MQQGISGKLDWSRMLGFEQVAGDRVDAKIGSKVGGKPVNIGAKIGLKPGFKPTTIGNKIGIKVGLKPAA